MAEEDIPAQLHWCQVLFSGAICCRAFSRQLLRSDIDQSGRVFSTLCQLERHGKSRPQEAAGWVRRYSTNHIVHWAWCMQLSRSGWQVKRQCVQKLWAARSSLAFHISDHSRHTETEIHAQTMLHGKVAQEGSATAGTLFIFPQPKSLHIIPPVASGI